MAEPRLYAHPEGLHDRASNQLSFIDKQYLTKNTIEVVDLLCEGEIDGLVNKEYKFVGTLGNIGYDSYTQTTLTGPSGSSDGFLRSVYLNRTPVISNQGFYNFQTFQLEATYGHPNGSLFQYGQGSRLSVTRIINEKFRGSDVSFDRYGQPYPGEKNNFKFYKILNKECDLFSVNLKIISLGETTVDNGVWPNSITSPNGPGFETLAGSTLPSKLYFAVYYKPLYNNNLQNLNARWEQGFRRTLYGSVTLGLMYEAIVNPNPAFMTDKNFIGWELLVVRFTPDSLTRTIQNTVFIDSITEATSEKFTYPNSALVKSRFDAEYFNQIPSRQFDVRGLKVKIPSTYDPILRKYDEPSYGWDGTFKEEKEWTNNPVWCYYDLLTNKRYGLGKTIDESLIDKFTLYEISKYCDQLVSNERGELEPRFTCNLQLNSREEAFKVLSDIASIFRGMTYYGLGAIAATQDAPKDPLLIFTNSNVENQNFNYSSSAKKLRHNVAIVRFNDPEDNYKAALEVVEDFDSIRRYGVRETDLTAFGCTSRSQAIRQGRWLLLTENTETELVNFKTDTLASYLRPGDIFGIIDSNKKLQRLCGRTLQFENNYPTGAKIIVDSELSLATGNVYSFSLLAAKSYYEPSLISDLTSNDTSNIHNSLIYKQNFTGIQGTGLDSNNKSIIYLPLGFTNFTNDYAPNSVWTIELADGSFNQTDLRTYLNSGTDYYRVLTIEEEEPLKYQISALQYNKDKFLAIDSGIAYQRSSQQVATIPATPTDLNLTLIDNIYSKSIDYRFSPGSSQTAITHYKIYGKLDDFNSDFNPANEFLVGLNNYNNFGGVFSPPTTGDYFLRVYGYNAEGDIYSSSYAGANIHVPVSPVPIEDVTISSIILAGYTGAYQDGVIRGVETTEIDPAFTWQVGFKNPENPFISRNFNYRISVRKPSATSLPDTTIYYETTGIASTGRNTAFTFNFELNKSLSNGPYRSFDIVVEGIDSLGNTSAGNTIRNQVVDEPGWVNNLDGFDILNVQNPAVTGFILSSGSSHGNGYQSTQFFTSAREAIVLFSGDGIDNQFKTDIIGGVVLVSPKYFSGYDAATGRADIAVSAATWDSETSSLYAPLAIKTFDVPTTNYISISLYDSFDQSIRNTLPLPQRIRYYTGLYIAPSVPFSGDGLASSLTFTTTGNTQKFSVKSNRNTAGQHELLLVDSENPTIPSILHTFS